MGLSKGHTFLFHSASLHCNVEMDTNRLSIKHDQVRCDQPASLSITCCMKVLLERNIFSNFLTYRIMTQRATFTQGNNDKCVGIEVQHNEFLLEKKKYITKLEVLESLLVTAHSNLKHISCLQTSCFLHMHADTFTDFPLNSRNLTLQLTVFVNKKNPPVDPTVLKRCLSILEAVCTNRLVALLLKISVLLKKM